VSVAKSRATVASYLKDHPKVTLEWLLAASGLSKNAWYHKTQAKVEPLIEKQLIESVLIESPYYGYKRVTKELNRNGTTINHKRVYKIMGEYHLLQVRKSKSVPHTTNSKHNLLVYANEVKYLGSVVPGRVWVSDVTYVWIGDKWAYLALIMDQGSRRIVGSILSHSLHRSLCIDALTMALKDNPAPGFHHSDRGVQYCSYDYIDILKAHQITPSMAAVGLSVDNPYAESLNRSIKVEEVYLKAYESFAEADSSIKKYIEVYNTKRLHSSLGYVPPVEYEANYQLMNLSKVDTLVVSN
jgi:transposase InsO family protein